MPIYTVPKPVPVPRATPVSKPTPREVTEGTAGFHNGDLVTVLHGYGSPSGRGQHNIDTYTFIDGVCHNVPWSVAQHWILGTRADGKPVYGRVVVQVVANDADEAEYVKAVGLQLPDAPRMAAMIMATDPDQLFDIIGPARAEQLVHLFADRLDELAAEAAAALRPIKTRRTRAAHPTPRARDR